MLSSKGQSEKFKGSNPSHSPTILEEGVFSLCSGGVPKHGAFGRLPGKTLKSFDDAMGGVIAISEFGQKVVVQFFAGIRMYDLTELFPNPSNYVYDNEGNLVTDNSGFPVTQ